MTESKSDKNFTRRLFSHTLNFGLGSVLPKIIGFFLIPVYTIYLSPEDFGIIELATSFSAFLLIFMRLGVPGSVTRFFFDYPDQNQLRNYITTIFWFLIFCSVIIGGIVWLIGYFYFEKLIPGLPFLPFGILVIIIAFFNSNSDLQRRLIQVREQSAYAAKLSIAIALITIFFSVVLVVGFKMGALGIIIALLITAIIFFIQAQFYLHNDLKGKIQLSYLKPSLLYAMGILPSHVIGSFAPLLNKSLLAETISLSAVGLLGIALRFTSPLNIFLGAFRSAYLPIYYSYRKESNPDDEHKLKAANAHIWFIACLLFLGTIFFLPKIIVLLTPEKFHGSTALISTLALGFLISIYGTLFNVEIYYSKATHWIPLITTLAISANLAVVFFSVKYWGAFSVVLGMTIGQGVSTLLFVLIASKIFKMSWNKNYFKFTFLYCGLAFFIYTYFLVGSGIHLKFELLIYFLIILIFTVTSIYSIDFNPKAFFKRKS